MSTYSYSLTVCFGCYQHHVPATFWQQITNGLPLQLVPLSVEGDWYLDLLSAHGMLGLDLSSLRYGGTAFNALMIRREALLKSVQLGGFI